MFQRTAILRSSTAFQGILKNYKGILAFLYIVPQTQTFRSQIQGRGKLVYTKNKGYHLQDKDIDMRFDASLLATLNIFSGSSEKTATRNESCAGPQNDVCSISKPCQAVHSASLVHWLDNPSSAYASSYQETSHYGAIRQPMLPRGHGGPHFVIRSSSESWSHLLLRCAQERLSDNTHTSHLHET